MRRRPRAAIWFGAVAVVLAAAALAAYGLGGSDGQQPAGSNLPPAIDHVTRATLTQTERVNGTLGYGAASTVIARASAATTTDTTTTTTTTAATTTKTITWLPVPGAVIQAGQSVYKVDDRAVVLISGATPLYRVLADGVKGADVKMLETNLKALGYSGFEVDTAYTSATAAAVKRWQKRLGWAETGTVDVNQVVVGPAPMRVAELKAIVGAEATGPVLTYTGTTRVVTIPLEVGKQHLVRQGLSATVRLPDGKTATGTIAGVGTVASGGDNGQGPPGSGGTGEPTIEVIVTISDQAALGTLDRAPVQLMLVTAQRENVLTVPVGALVALAEGGYGVQVVEGGATRYLAVKTGMFANGRVEVSGDGVTEGLAVGVPS
ncbi:MAG TPA: peptidoglycan-binding domain-containing protein [Candidatus Limnocylindrales bacterium]|nr:peptidoglycan-binding domain-containing protein [Candidatus Limnocylindrales bacterium]